jgi:hypothetical protein
MKLPNYHVLRCQTKLIAFSLLMFTMGCQSPTTVPGRTGASPSPTPVFTPTPAPTATPVPIVSATPGQPDTTPPIVTFTSPINAEIGVAVNRKIVATFSEVMDPASISASTFTVTTPGLVAVPGKVTYVGSVATFTPTNNLAPSTTFTATVTNAAKDLAGNAMTVKKSWVFTTDTFNDVTAPTASMLSPANGVTSVGINNNLEVTFSEVMDPETINTSTLILREQPGSIPVAGTVTYIGNVATFNPTNGLKPNTTYTGTITNGAKDLAGNAFASDKTWSFSTGSSGGSGGGGGGGGNTNPPPPDTTPPTLSATQPANAAISVATNGRLTVTFSEVMDPSTINTNTFTLVGPGVTPVPGTVTYVGTTGTFKPDSDLAPNTLFTATITTGVKDLAGNALAVNKVWTFTTGATSDETAPTVSLTTPVDTATGVAVNSAISSTFSEAMDVLSITSNNFKVTGPGLTPVSGAVTYVGNTATFTPTSRLAENTLFTATVTTDVKDLAGNNLAVNKVWTFTTGAAPDETAPTVSTTTPLNNTTAVAVNTALTSTFSEAMNPLTVTTSSFKLTGPGLTAVPGAVTYFGNTATFTPTSSLADNTLFTATVTTDVKDLAGNALAVNKVWTFTTGAAPDTGVPTVTATTPDNLGTSVLTTSQNTATFSEPMDPMTLTTATFTVTGPGLLPVAGTVTYLGNVATFTPATEFTRSTVYTATITTGAKDLAGNALAANKVWTFTTALGPAIVNLRTARDFTVMAKSGISSVPNSVITGDIGVSPIDLTAVTGFSTIMDSSNTFATSTQVTGRIYAANLTPPTPTKMTTAIGDMATAYSDAASRATPNSSELGAGQIGGLTLVPGLYKWGTDVLISTNVTLSGGPNDVWIFQIAGDLIQANNINVTLIGGAVPKNVFWQVAGSVSIGSNAHMEGIILCETAIHLGTGASANSRLLSQTAVTLMQNVVTPPAL